MYPAFSGLVGVRGWCGGGNHIYESNFCMIPSPAFYKMPGFLEDNRAPFIHSFIHQTIT